MNFIGLDEEENEVGGDVLNWEGMDNKVMFGVGRRGLEGFEGFFYRGGRKWRGWWECGYLIRGSLEECLGS
jgi:hypothetical protein